MFDRTDVERQEKRWGGRDIERPRVRERRERQAQVIFEREEDGERDQPIRSISALALSFKDHRAKLCLSSLIYIYVCVSERGCISVVLYVHFPRVFRVFSVRILSLYICVC